MREMERRARGARGLPPLAVRKAEAAAMLAVSVDFFEAHIAPEVRSVRRGRCRLYPVAELERWLDEAARGEMA